MPKLRPKPRQLVITRGPRGQWNFLVMTERETTLRQEFTYRVDLLRAVEEHIEKLVAETKP